MLLNIAQICQITSLSKSTTYRLIKEGTFPKPLRISRMRVGWKQSDLDAYIASRPTVG